MNKFNPEVRLKSHIDHLSKGGVFSPAEVREIFTLARVVLERFGLRRSFPVLTLYCDWLVHDRLDRSEGGLRVMKRVFDVVIRALDSTVVKKIDDNEDLAASISKAISLDTLHTELKTLLSSKHISTDIIESKSNWRGFVEAIVLAIIERPLSIPSDVMSNPNSKQPARKLYDEMEKECVAKNIKPHHCTVTKIEINQLDEEEKVRIVIHVSFNDHQKITIRTPLLLVLDESDFTDE